jgi:hypothetical protein
MLNTMGAFPMTHHVECAARLQPAESGQRTTS